MILSSFGEIATNKLLWTSTSVKFKVWDLILDFSSSDLSGILVPLEIILGILFY